MPEVEDAEVKEMTDDEIDRPMFIPPGLADANPEPATAEQGVA